MDFLVCDCLYSEWSQKLVNFHQTMISTTNNLQWRERWQRRQRQQRRQRPKISILILWRQGSFALLRCFLPQLFFKSCNSRTCHKSIFFYSTHLFLSQLQMKQTNEKWNKSLCKSMESLSGTLSHPSTCIPSLKAFKHHCIALHYCAKSSFFAQCKSK